MLRVLTDWYPQAVLDEAAVKQAATNGHLDLLWWMHKRMEMECSGMEKLCKLLYSSETVALVAGRGHLEVVKWLVEARGGECSAAPLHQAARNGQVEVVEWLYDHSGCIVLPRSMDEAAACGFLDVVRLLHERGGRNGGKSNCTTMAMTGAAVNGYLESSSGYMRIGMKGALLMLSTAQHVMDTWRWFSGCTRTGVKDARSTR
ncbi:hypothetical protein PI125_g10007 [Phytophthora idaei]|nr:hypothetical protein PI125_g10007 [Phytophthora idaei]